MRTFGSVLLALLLAGILAIKATTPPGASPVDSPAPVFSAGRAMADVQAIGTRPHITGTPENAAVRAHIARRMTELGMVVSTSTGTVDAAGMAKRNRWTGRQDAPVTLTNVIGVLPGRDASLPAVLLMSHHDSVWGSPGAADNSAGVAASLEVVRALRAAGPQQRDLIVLVTDAEELGLQGAREFFASHPLRERVGAVINMEARGGGGRTTLFETSRQNGEAVELYAQAVARPGASSLAAFVYSVLPNDTDLSPVIDAGYLSYNFAFIGRPGLYHSPLATPANLDQGALQDMGDQVLDLTTALLGSSQLPQPAPDRVFFDVFGLFTAVYPSWLGWLQLGLAAAGLVLVVRRDGTRGLVGGAARMLALLLGSAVLFYLLNRLSIGLTPSNYYDRLAAIARLELMVGLGAIAAFVALFGRLRPIGGASVGAAAPLLLIGFAAQALAPTAAYVVILPLLVVAIAMLIRSRLVQVGAGALVIGYMIALGHQLMQGVGPTMPMAAALPLSLAALALLPLWPGLPVRKARLLGIAALVGAAAVALWVQLDAPAASMAVYADTKR